jgi:predicted lipid-binding transport protein (Tim44 family)
MYIILLIILTFILFKALFSSFGFIPAENKNKKNEALDNFIKKLSMTSGGVKTNQNSNPLEEMYNNYVKRLKNVSNADNKTPTNNSFDEKTFIKSAERAVVAVLEAFSQKKFDILENLLARGMLNTFKENVQKAEVDGFSYKTVVISFENSTILKKNLDSEAKTVKVKFLMKQINYVENKEGDVVSGSKSKVEDIVEEWTFVQSDVKENYWLLKSID